MDNNVYNEALKAIVGKLGNFTEPSMRMAIESYYTNPVLHPISAYKTNQAEDRFRDVVASLNLLENDLRRPGAGVFPDGVTRVKNPTFEDKLRAAQRKKYDLAGEQNPFLNDDEAALEAEKRNVEYRKPKYY